MGTQVFPIVSFQLISSSMSAEIKLGNNRFGARTDGGLQISLQHPSLITWDRSYYEIALEVTILFCLDANCRQNGFSKSRLRPMEVKIYPSSVQTILFIADRYSPKC